MPTKHAAKTSDDRRYFKEVRFRQIRALVDGYAGACALTGAHELGHLAGLGHDETDARSIMNVAEGGLQEGLKDVGLAMEAQFARV